MSNSRGTYTTHITGSTIGAFSQGAGASATGRVTTGGAPSEAETFNFEFKGYGLSREELAKRLQQAATAVLRGNVNSDAQGTVLGLSPVKCGSASAWTLEVNE